MSPGVEDLEEGELEVLVSRQNHGSSQDFTAMHPDEAPERSLKRDPRSGQKRHGYADDSDEDRLNKGFGSHDHKRTRITSGTLQAPPVVLRRKPQSATPGQAASSPTVPPASPAKAPAALAQPPPSASSEVAPATNGSDQLIRPLSNRAIEINPEPKSSPAGPSNGQVSKDAAQERVPMDNASTANAEEPEDGEAAEREPRGKSEAVASFFAEHLMPYELLGSQSRAETELKARLRARSKTKSDTRRVHKFLGCSAPDSYDMRGGQLGEGTFGVVLKGKHVVTGQFVALKRVTVHEEKDGISLTTIREIKLMKALRHPNITPIIDIVHREMDKSPGEIYMVLPYMDHDLAGLLDAYELSIPQIKLYFRQLLEGTLELHSNNLVHRDIKSANLLISNDGTLKIADFGLARSLHNPQYAACVEGAPNNIEYTGMVVTRWYRPPELLAGRKNYGKEVDMWGIGCILVEMFYRKPYFMGSSEVDQFDLIAKVCGSPNEDTLPGWNSLPGVRNADAQGRLDESITDGVKEFGPYPRRLKQELTMGTKVHLVDGAAALADKLLVLDPQKRYTAADALLDDWLYSLPGPADPVALPVYPPKKESDKKRKEQQERHHSHAQQRFAAASASMMPGGAQPHQQPMQMPRPYPHVPRDPYQRVHQRPTLQAPSRPSGGAAGGFSLNL